MKKLYTLLLLVASSTIFAQVSEPFAGTGALNANGWLTHSGTTPGQLMIASGSLTYAGINSTGNKVELVAGNTEDVNLASSAALTGVVYYSTIMNVVNTEGLNLNSATGDYSIGLTATVGSTNVTAFSGRTYLRAGSVENTFNLGLLNNSGGAATPSYLSTDFPINVPVFIVVKYDLSSNTASLWVNPAIGGSETAANATNATGTTAAPAQIAGIFLRQGGNATAGTGNVQYDEIRVNSTWASVTSANLSVNQNAIAGLKVYPNPVVDGTLNITTQANAERTIQVYDILGKQVVNKVTSNEAINVSNLKAGVYIVKITEEGKTASRKLVIN